MGAPRRDGENWSCGTAQVRASHQRLDYIAFLKVTGTL